MFQPLYDSHAIREAVFVVSPAEPIPASLVTEISSDLKVPWRDVLPRRVDVQEYQLKFQRQDPRSAPALSRSPPNGVQYEGMKPDGGKAWGITIGPQHIAVNCLAYEGWKRTWPQVRGWLEWILNQEQAGSLKIRSFALQYINAFKWHGEAQDCTPRHILKASSPEIPASLYEVNDGRWHFHIGSFMPGTEIEAYPGERLQRIHLSGKRLTGPGPEEQFEMVADVMARTIIEEPVNVGAQFGRGSPADMAFEMMHDLVKRRLAAYISDEMGKRIGLDV